MHALSNRKYAAAKIKIDNYPATSLSLSLSLFVSVSVSLPGVFRRLGGPCAIHMDPKIRLASSMIEYILTQNASPPLPG